MGVLLVLLHFHVLTLHLLCRRERENAQGRECKQEIECTCMLGKEGGRGSERARERMSVCEKKKV